MLPIDWKIIKAHDGSQDFGFEELCSQLFSANEPPNKRIYVRRGVRDAGLEGYFEMEDGSVRGFQAKYFLQSPNASQWDQIKKSVTTAIGKNPTLEHLTVCIPQNFDDPKIKGKKSAMDKWAELRDEFEAAAIQAGRTVKIHLWGASELLSELMKPNHAGVVRYFFDVVTFNRDWYSQHFKAVAANAGPRYTPELNVALPIAQVFEGLGRTSEFARQPQMLYRSLDRQITNLQRSYVPDHQAQDLEALLAEGAALRSLLESSEFHGALELPLDHISGLARKLGTAAWDLRNAIESAPSTNRTRKGGEDVGEVERERQRQLEATVHSLREISDTASDLTEIETAGARAGNSGSLLVTGSAGKGKTHLFLDVARNRIDRNLPTFVFLGEQFSDEDPFQQLMVLTGFAGGRDDFLQAMQVAAKVAGSKFLILIDAINDGTDLSLWNRNLAGFLKTLSGYPWIAVGLSVRTTYEEAVVPEVVRKSIVRIFHGGFGAQTGQAMKTYFDHYGINLPSVPPFTPEFSDPLFLKLFCQGLQAEGLHDVPPGYSGISRTFTFLMTAIEKKLRRERKINALPSVNVAEEYCSQFAGKLMETSKSELSLEVAFELSESISASSGYPESLLSHLISEGLLSEDWIRADDGKGCEGVRFAYQRFGDHEFARRLLDSCDANGATKAFKKGGDIWTYLSAEECRFGQSGGVLEALAIQVPSTFGFELATALDVLEDWDEDAFAETMAEVLIESLRWRPSESITSETFRELKRLVRTEHSWSRYVLARLAIGSVPDHELNAESTHIWLSKMTLADRDALWSIPLIHSQYDHDEIERVLSWSLASSSRTHVSDKALSLTATTLCWLCALPSAVVRDRATKGLVRLLDERPSIAKELFGRFSDTNDRSVIERLCAATYGATMRTSDLTVLHDFAECAIKFAFAGEQTYPDLMARDYCRGIVDRATKFGAKLSINPQRTRPPYNSELPAEPPSRECLDALVPDGQLKNEDRALAQLIHRFGKPDMSEYYGGPDLSSSHVTKYRLDSVRPLTKQELLDRLRESLSSKQAALLREAESLRSDMVFFGAKRIILTLEDPTIEIPDFSQEAVTAAFDKFRIALSANQKAKYDEYEATTFESSDEAGLENDLLPRLVISGALELGWTKDRFAEFDNYIERIQPLHRNRRRQIDSIAAKYLWIAYNDVMARLTDNYHINDVYGFVEYQGPWQFYLRTIDPSVMPCLQSDSDNRRSGPCFGPDFLPRYEIDSVGDWVIATDDLPKLDEQMCVVDKVGEEWILLQGYFDWQLGGVESDDRDSVPKKMLWTHVNGYLVREPDADSFRCWAAKQRFMGRWMPEGGNRENHGMFLGEFFWSAAWQSIANDERSPYTDWDEPAHEAPCEVATVADRYLQDRDDLSTSNHLRQFIPSRLLVSEGKLTWDAKNHGWQNEAGEIVIFAPPTTDVEKRQTLLAKSSFLTAFCKENGYRLFWTIPGEKQVLHWLNSGTTLEINGVGEFLDGRVSLTIDTLARHWGSGEEVGAEE